MKSLTDDDIDVLNRIKQDIDISIESNFNSFGNVFLSNLLGLTPIFTSLYFKILNHNPENKFWKNRDIVFATNNFSNIVKNISEVHAGYTSFNLLQEYLKENKLSNIENSIAEAIANYIATKDLHDNHLRYYYVIMSDVDAFNNLSSFEYIIKNNIGKIITILYTRTSSKDLNEENRLNGRLIGLGFDTLVVSADNVVSVVDAINYAKRLNKPTVILANIN